ncbi:hypothetical protein EDB85DRAFT_2182775 [Lactarius pseudohatsudake]|nr:hypothetical protein EDB85DRAFT_2182775 [Lactarius pseudohatsudake]
MVQQFWTLRWKQNVPATYADVAGTFCFRHGDRAHAPSSSLIPALLRATQFAQNWVCKERRTPAPPSTPPAPLAHPIRVEKGTQEGRPTPLSSLHREGRTGGAHHGAYGASPFARKGGRTRAYRSRRPPPSSPLSAPPHSRGKGAHKGTPPPVPPFPSEGVRTRYAVATLSPAPPFLICAEGGHMRAHHPTRPLRVAPAPSSLRPGHATLASLTRHACARLVTQKGWHAHPGPFSVGDASPAPRTPPRPPLACRGVQEGLHAHP